MTRRQELLAAKRSYPPDWLHESWLDYLDWVTELECRPCSSEDERRASNAEDAGSNPARAANLSLVHSAQHKGRASCRT